MLATKTWLKIDLGTFCKVSSLSRYLINDGPSLPSLQKNNNNKIKPYSINFIPPQFASFSVLIFNHYTDTFISDQLLIGSLDPFLVEDRPVCEELQGP